MRVEGGGRRYEGGGVRGEGVREEGMGEGSELYRFRSGSGHRGKYFESGPGSGKMIQIQLCCTIAA